MPSRAFCLSEQTEQVFDPQYIMSKRHIGPKVLEATFTAKQSTLGNVLPAHTPMSDCGSEQTMICTMKNQVNKGV